LREVALCGSFSEAAQRLSYSQSAVSQQIAQLERQVGLRLLERRGRSATLTPAGRALVQRTEVILVELSRAQAELDAAGGAPRGSLRLAVPPPSMGTWLPAALQSLRRHRPDLLVALSIAGAWDAVGMVTTGDADIGVIAGAASEPGVVTMSLLDEQLHVALPAQHPKADQHTIELADLADEDWILTTGPDSDFAVDACRHAGFSPRVTVRTDDAFAAQGLVAAGVGLAVLGALESSLWRRRDITLRGVGITRPVFAVTAGTPRGDIEVVIREMRRAAIAWPAQVVAQVSPMGDRDPRKHIISDHPISETTSTGPNREATEMDIMDTVPEPLVGPWSESRHVAERVARMASCSTADGLVAGA
jgi:DNA-binding transcriptional LysR family regulator